jgi:hypothetical protein
LVEGMDKNEEGQFEDGGDGMNVLGKRAVSWLK